MDKQIKFLIRVDRSVKPSYTNWFRWFKKLMHPELELTGPADQLGLVDLLAIQAKGIKVFRKLYQGKVVFGWKSVIELRGGDLFVPCLYEGGGRGVLGWRWLDSHWLSHRPALRFRK